MQFSLNNILILFCSVSFSKTVGSRSGISPEYTIEIAWAGKTQADGNGCHPFRRFQQVFLRLADTDTVDIFLYVDAFCPVKDIAEVGCRQSHIVADGLQGKVDIPKVGLDVLLGLTMIWWVLSLRSSPTLCIMPEQ